MLWSTAVSLLCAVIVWSQGDPLGAEGRFEPALPLLFFLASLTALSTVASALLALVLALLASWWRLPQEPGTGFVR